MAIIPTPPSTNRSSDNSHNSSNSHNSHNAPNSHNSVGNDTPIQINNQSSNCALQGFKIPLRLLIIVPFLLNTFGIVGLIGWLSFQNGHNAVKQLSNQLRNKVTEQVKIRLDAYLQLPYALNKLNSNSINLGQIDTKNESRVQRFFWKQLQSFDQISHIYVATTSGRYSGARRIDNILTVENATTVFATDDNGRAQSILFFRPPFQLSDRPWYSNVISSNKEIWSEVYTDPYTNESGITALKPLYEADGRLQGVLGVSMSLGEINQFLRNTKVSDRGHTFIIDSAGKLVAASNDNISISSQRSRAERILATESTDALTRIVANQLNKNSSFPTDQIQQSVVEFNGEKYFFQVSKLDDIYGLDWQVAVILPESDFMAQINDNSRYTAFLCLVALSITTVLGIFASRWLTHPIIQLSGASQLIAQGNLDQKVASSSFVKELAILATSFNQMSRQMQRSHHRLEEYSRLLMEKVDERTQALQQEILQHEVTEAALRDSEEKFAKAFRSSPDGMALLSLGTSKHIDVNDKWIEITGFSREEAIGANPSDLNLWIDLKERDRMLAILETEKRVANYEAQFMTKDGRKIIGLISSECIEIGDQGFAIYAIKDISDRKQIEENIKESEKKYRDLVESANCIILRWDKHGRICFLNDYGLKFFGYELEEVIGKYVLDTIVSTQSITGEDLQNMIVDICKSPNKYQLNENENLCKDGRRVWVTWSNKPIFNDQGELIELLSVGTDITDRKQAEKELQLAKEIADTANRAKSEFLANMSHELRTPLNGILGYAQILKRGYEPEKHKTGLDIIQRSGEHLLTLLNDILDLSKIEAKKLELNPSEFELPKLLQSIIDIFQLQVREKQVEMVYQPLTNLPTIIYGDEKRLRQVLINLFGNAVKFTDQGTVSLRVSAQPCATPFHYRIRFEIADTGVGIDPDKLEDIFLPFQQVGDRARRYSGTGLGLPICKKIVEMMGGNLEVESSPHLGSTFWFEIELVEVAQYQHSLPPDSRTIIGYGGDRRKILVVDDKTENRMVLNDLLTPLGFIVAEAIDGRDCLVQAQQFAPDLVLLDMVMPELDGHETAIQLRQLEMFKHTAIVMVSASAFSQDRDRSIQVGCNAFITKPINPDALFQTMRSLLHLEWQYEAEIPATSGINAAATPIQEYLAGDQNRSVKGYENGYHSKAIAIPATTLDRLTQLSRIGDILTIQDEALLLQEEHPEFHSFTTKILNYAHNFEIRKIRELLAIQRQS